MNIFGNAEIDGSLLEAIWGHCDIGLAKVGLDGKWLAVNPKVEDMLGYTAERLQKMSFQDITHKEDVGDDVEMVQAVIDGKRPSYSMSKRYITASDVIIRIKLVVHPLRNEQGKCVAFLSQIIPPEYLPKNAEKVQLIKESNLEIREPSYQEFFKTNWKWIAGAVVSLAVGVHQFFLKIDQSNNKIAHLEKQAEAQMKSIQELLNQIQGLKIDGAKSGG